MTNAPAIIIPGQPIGYMCLICKTPFKDTEAIAYRAHLKRCFSENENELRAGSHEATSPELFGKESGDYEKHNWVKKYKKPLIKGDMKL